ncbi:hypothetical protein [Prevotella denticola]|uniref:hypothetical protein n=1 Tax=Prevotella denticola TaxID=28129 RepID=UPI001C5E005E|nr:hypothetical protein [Prevotella denticola]MBW4714425.1 hypothetical protein [Prevotella denticola]MBW4752865.1 hypothetical protein [Prevotella denticola]
MLKKKAVRKVKEELSKSINEEKTRIGKKLLEKRKVGLKNLRNMRRPRGWDRSLPEERKRND